MTRHFCAFDIETFVNDAGETKISCIGAAWQLNPGMTQVWYGNPEVRPDTIKEFIDFLNYQVAQGFYIVTWNGLGYDFKVLHDNASDDNKKRIAHLATSDFHIDPMFQFLCMKGFPVGIKAVAEGMMLGSKTEGMDGLIASETWVSGTKEDRLKILEYVVQDARLALTVVEALEEGRNLVWITKKGYLKSLAINPLLPITQCLKIPLPDTSWMTEPMTRDYCYSWVMG